MAWHFHENVEVIFAVGREQLRVFGKQADGSGGRSVPSGAAANNAQGRARDSNAIGVVRDCSGAVLQKNDERQPVHYGRSPISGLRRSLDPASTSVGCFANTAE